MQARLTSRKTRLLPWKALKAESARFVGNDEVHIVTPLAKHWPGSVLKLKLRSLLNSESTVSAVFRRTGHIPCLPSTSGAAAKEMYRAGVNAFLGKCTR